ncbi:RPN3 [Hepatospora eriocheir]|uniref:RPN3 n=1 Tax=Hepatospora eriocheir TaxID=1081669 RepID=A0A1X0QDZ1_9MICR|nr:RPN3 [Hepatospora eriocheir]
MRIGTKSELKEYLDKTNVDYKILFNNSLNLLTSNLTIDEIIDLNIECIPLVLGVFYKEGMFSEIEDMVETVNRPNSNFIESFVIKYKYLVDKINNNVDIDELYRELFNSRLYMKGQLVNCILDYNINNNIYKTIDWVETDSNDINSYYYFYIGYINLILNNLDESLYNFNESEIFIKDNDELLLKINKYKILINVLKNNFNIKISDDSLNSYAELINYVSSGNIDELNRLLDTKKNEFINDRVYFIIKRLLSNTLIQGIKSISLCYLRIKIDDISKLLKYNIEYLIRECIKDGIICGCIEDGVLITSKCQINNSSNKDIQSLILLKNTIYDNMIYNDIPVLNYEIVKKEADALEEKY